MKGKNPAIKDWDEARLAMRNLADLEAELRATQALLDAAVANASARFAGTVSALQSEIGAEASALKKFATAHKSEFKARAEGGDTRSFEHANVTIGFRKGRPAVKVKNEESAIEWLKSTFGGFFLRMKPEIDKDAIHGAIKACPEFIEPRKTPEQMEWMFGQRGITLTKPKDKFFCDVKEQQ